MNISLGRPDAIARIAGNNHAPCLYGSIKFYQVGRNVLIVADVCGLPKSDTGLFALYVHEREDRVAELEDAEGHYAPDNMLQPNNSGDLPPLLSCSGSAFFAVLTNRFRIAEVMGKNVVIHGKLDNFHSQSEGKAGAGIACGMISQR